MDAGQNFRATESRLGPELFRPAIATLGLTQYVCYRGRAMWSIESSLCLSIPVTRLPKPGVIALDSSKSGCFSLLSTRSLSELVINARFLRPT
jgi:hypothetical protein